MTPREWVGQLSRSVGGIPPTDRDALGQGLSELLAAREPAKDAPIGVGTRFRCADGHEWSIVRAGDRFNVRCHDSFGGLLWSELNPQSLDTIAAEVARAGWTRLPDQTDHATEVARLRAELAAKDKVIADNNEEYARLSEAFRRVEAERDTAYANATAAYDARDRAEARTAELEQAIRALIGKLEA